MATTSRAPEERAVLERVYRDHLVTYHMFIRVTAVFVAHVAVVLLALAYFLL